MATTGRYEERDGQPVVRFERTVAHPVTTVWEAVTEPAQLEEWFPTSVALSALAPGAGIEFHFPQDAYPPMTGKVLAVEPERRFEFTWGEDRLTFELEPHDGGEACRLSLTVVLDGAEKAARDAAGRTAAIGVDELADYTYAPSPKAEAALRTPIRASVELHLRESARPTN